jgi:hypothetical protein
MGLTVETLKEIYLIVVASCIRSEVHASVESVTRAASHTEGV